MRKRTLGLLMPLLLPLGLTGGCPLLGGCKSSGAGWEFSIQTAGLTIRYHNRANSEGEYEFVQTFDPEGADIVLNGIKNLFEDDKEEEKLDDGGSSSDSNGIE